MKYSILAISFPLSNEIWISMEMTIVAAYDTLADNNSRLLFKISNGMIFHSNIVSKEDIILYSNLYLNPKANENGIELYTREKSIFLSDVDKVKYPNSTKQYRLTKITEER